jgi:hypothetical protein
MIDHLVLDALTEMGQGNWITGIFYPYLAAFHEWFWGILIMMAGMAIYVKTGNIISIVTLFLLGGGLLFFMLPPESHKIVYVLLALGITATIYKLLRGRYGGY